MVNEARNDSMADFRNYGNTDSRRARLGARDEEIPGIRPE